jgi:CDP-diacylglycerol--glycerol-3-phosphate 3-phosphatidyltransferase
LLSLRRLSEHLKGDEDIINLPNLLTVARIATAPAIAALLSRERKATDELAAGTIALAALTDYLDGYLARRWNQVTSLGQFMDPLADKIYISTSYLMLVKRGELDFWVPAVIIGREIAITLFRAYAGSRGSSVPASMLGKLKANFQLLSLLLSIPKREGRAWRVARKLSLATALFFTIYSGWDYVSRSRFYLREEKVEALPGAEAPPKER